MITFLYGRTFSLIFFRHGSDNSTEMGAQLFPQRRTKAREQSGQEALLPLPPLEADQRVWRRVMLQSRSRESKGRHDDNEHAEMNLDFLLWQSTLVYLIIPHAESTLVLPAQKNLIFFCTPVPALTLSFCLSLSLSLSPSPIETTDPYSIHLVRTRKYHCTHMHCTGTPKYVQCHNRSEGCRLQSLFFVHLASVILPMFY